MNSSNNNLNQSEQSSSSSTSIVKNLKKSSSVYGVGKKSDGDGVFRSEKMVLCQLFLQSSVAFDAASKLGDLGILELRDLNSNINAFQRAYVSELRRLGDIQRKLVYLNDQMVSADIVPKTPEQEPMIIIDHRKRQIVNLETHIEQFDSELREINDKLLNLRMKEFTFVETSKLLSITQQISEVKRRASFIQSDQQNFSANDFPENSLNLEMASLENNDLNNKKKHDPQQDSNKIFAVAGLIRAEKVLPFQKVMWRVCGQNAFCQFYEIEEPIDDVRTNELIQKKVFLVMCQGNKLHAKVQKICESFHATQYDLPEDDEQFRMMSTNVEKELIDMRIVIERTREQKLKTLMALAEEENFQTWVILVTKLRAIFIALNMFQRTEKGFLAEGWCATNDFPLLVDLVNELNQNYYGQACLEVVKTDSQPPTYFRSNRFTNGFQNIVDSYGVASYREMNPAPYTIITFPFLFAMMFADAGHGFIMMLFGLWMVLYEKKLQGKNNNEIWLTFFNGRYIIMLMGAFSIYTGSIYNDIFAKGYNLFGTAFDHELTVNNTKSAMSYLNKLPSKTYPYGIDPAWQISSNKILFLNSFKMKLSVIVGVTQMFFGVILSLFNHINRKSWISIIFEFIPQIIFLLALFGYMNTLIFAKWLIKWQPNLAPSILIDFINMFLNKYPDEPKYLSPWFANKQLLQIFLLILALLQVPIMLLVKPSIIIYKRSKNRNNENLNSEILQQQQQQFIEIEMDEQSDTSSSIEQSKTPNKQNVIEQNTNNEKHEESIGDIYIHQAIHTIEYCLGSISHTASYLRLWALSLAHSQLSEVLWSMVMKEGFASPPDQSLLVRVLKTYIAFGIWAVLTVAILIVMEGLSAFLHALRLHWVEFQSKFYSGTGVQFRPFSMKKVLEETNILTE